MVLREESEYVIKGIKFSILSPDEIRKLSVVGITVPDTYDEEWTPIPFGLMDSRLGTIEPLQSCATCGERMESCPGHFGRIELVRPVIHVGFIKNIYQALQATCVECKRILLKKETIEKVNKMINKYAERNQYFFVNLLINLSLKKASKTEVCPHCKTPQPKIKFERPFNFYEESEKGTRILTPYDIYERFKQIPDSDAASYGIPTSFILMKGSGEITVLVEKLTLFPERLFLNLPSLPLSL